MTPQQLDSGCVTDISTGTEDKRVDFLPSGFLNLLVDEDIPWHH